MQGIRQTSPGLPIHLTSAPIPIQRIRSPSPEYVTHVSASYPQRPEDDWTVQTEELQEALACINPVQDQPSSWLDLSDAQSYGFMALRALSDPSSRDFEEMTTTLQRAQSSPSTPSQVSFPRLHISPFVSQLLESPVKGPSSFNHWVTEMLRMERYYRRRGIGLHDLLSQGLSLAGEILSVDPRSKVHITTQRIASVILGVLKHRDEGVNLTRTLEQSEARTILDVLQNILDYTPLYWFVIRKARPVPAYRGVRRRLIRVLIKISSDFNEYPSSLFAHVSLPNKLEDARGGFSDIYKGYCRGTLVAVKRLRILGQRVSPATTERRLRKEGLLWRQLRHDNILTFVGFVESIFNTPSACLVSPWMPHGNIIDYLASVQNRELGLTLRFVEEIASGINYLHDQSIVHGDIRGANILVNENLTACIADFGLADIYDDTSRGSASNQAGATAWMAPELHFPTDFGLSFTRTPKSDVYAFGCTCLELFTLEPPFGYMRPALLWRKISHEERPPFPTADECGGESNMLPLWLWTLITRCWVNAPTDRPPMASVANGCRGRAYM